MTSNDAVQALSAKLEMEVRERRMHRWGPLKFLPMAGEGLDGYAVEDNNQPFDLSGDMTLVTAVPVTRKRGAPVQKPRLVKVDSVEVAPQAVNGMAVPELGGVVGEFYDNTPRGVKPIRGKELASNYELPEGLEVSTAAQCVDKNGERFFVVRPKEAEGTALLLLFTDTRYASFEGGAILLVQDGYVERESGYEYARADKGLPTLLFALDRKSGRVTHVGEFFPEV